ncbi:MAG: nucleotidyltransferase family protein [Bacteroidales bacterium]|nr:nucleotidyltransferase family protein [Bacteroidales bacterium]
MKTLSECLDILRPHIEEFQSRFHVSRMGIFGSVSRGEETEDSDIDILVDMPPKLALLVELKEILENLLGASVDLIRNHKNLTPFFTQQIQKDCIYVF